MDHPSFESTFFPSEIASSSFYVHLTMDNPTFKNIVFEIVSSSFYIHRTMDNPTFKNPVSEIVSSSFYYNVI